MIMTSLQRHLAVMRGEIPNRIPIAPRIWAWLLEYGKTQLELKKEFDFDPLEIVSSDFPYHIDYTYDYMKKFPDSQHLKNVKQEIIKEKKDNDSKLYVTHIYKTPAGELKQIWAHPDPDDKSYGIQPNPHLVEPLVKDRSDIEKMKYIFITQPRIPVSLDVG